MSSEVASRPRVGRTGARFNGARWADDDPALAADPAADPPPPEDPVGQTGARFGGARRRGRTPTPAPVVVPGPRPSPDPVAELPSTDEIPIAPSTNAVRPYVLTRGRTRSAVALPMDALLSAVPPTGVTAPLRPELRTALALCAEPRSVAELAARLDVPLGVAAVLLGDLVDGGLVRVHHPSQTRPDLALMQRVLHGLHRL